jgi:hypothetical protein
MQKNGCAFQRDGLNRFKKRKNFNSLINGNLIKLHVSVYERRNLFSMATFISTILKTEINLWPRISFAAPKRLIIHLIETAVLYVRTQRSLNTDRQTDRQTEGDEINLTFSSSSQDS